MNKGIKNTIALGLGYILVKWTVIILAGTALYKSGYWNNWYLAAIPVIGLTAFFVRRKIKSDKNKKEYVDN